jgi:hypothetical protein
LLEDESSRDIFRDKDEAKKSGNKIMQSIFSKIFVEFTGNYRQFIDDVISKYSKRLNKEFNSVKPLLGSEKSQMIAKINDYLGEIDGYIYGK